MKKEILITLLCADLMLVTPFTTIAQENKVSSNLTEKPDINGLIVQIRTVVNEILQKYGNIPMVRGLCNVILNSLGLFVFWLICEIIFIICLLFVPVVWFCVIMGLGYIGQNIAWYISTIASTLDRECPDNPFEQSFHSIYTMLETKDNINTFDGCPCLEE